MIDLALTESRMYGNEVGKAKHMHLHLSIHTRIVAIILICARMSLLWERRADGLRKKAKVRKFTDYRSWSLKAKHKVMNASHDWFKI